MRVTELRVMKVMLGDMMTYDVNENFSEFTRKFATVAVT